MARGFALSMMCFFEKGASRFKATRQIRGKGGFRRERVGGGGGLRVKWLIPPFAIICDITTYSVPPLYPKLDNPFLSITTKYQNLYYIFV